MPESGLTPPIVAQIAKELRMVYPAIIGDHPPMYVRGFKYDSALEGIRVHADFAAVDVNFWITPDAAHLDPAHGGLVIRALITAEGGRRINVTLLFGRREDPGTRAS